MHKKFSLLYTRQSIFIRYKSIFLRQRIHGAVLAETMEQKTFIFAVRQRFMEWFVSQNFWLNSRNYFQFPIVSVDGHTAYLKV